MRRELLILSVLIACGCSQKRQDMANGKATADVQPGEYGAALNHWSRTEKVYEKLETRLIVNATWRSGAFRDAWADEWARRYVLSDAERDEIKRREHGDSESYHEFFFAAYTPETRWNDFSKRDSMWRLRLFDDAGNSVEPLVVTKVKNDDPKAHAFYPYFTLWTKGYVVKFPRGGLSPDSKTLRFQLTSGVGAAELLYERANADTPSPVRVEKTSPTASAAP